MTSEPVTYTLRTVSDLLKIPPERLDFFLRDLHYALEMAHFVSGEAIEASAFEEFHWTDDGDHSVDISVNGRREYRLEVRKHAEESNEAIKIET